MQFYTPELNELKIKKTVESYIFHLYRACNILQFSRVGLLQYALHSNTFRCDLITFKLKLGLHNSVAEQRQKTSECQNYYLYLPCNFYFIMKESLKGTIYIYGDPQPLG